MILSYARLTAVILLAATLFVGAALVLGKSGALPYEGELRWYVSASAQFTLDVSRGMSEALIALPLDELSPDGRYGVSYGIEAFVVDARSNTRRTLPPYAGNVSWSPDSTRMAFTSSPNGLRSNRRLFLANGDGSNAHQVTAENLDFPHWSPDSQAVLVTNNRELYRLDALTETLRVLTQVTRVSAFAWSYDGAYIAYATYEEGVYTLQVINADGSNRRTLLRLPSLFTADWSPASHELLIAARTDSGTVIYVADVSNDIPQVRRVAGDNILNREAIYNLRWHPDGVRILLPAYFGANGSMMVIDSLSGQVQFLLESSYFLALSPDGEQLAFTPNAPYLGQTSGDLCFVTMGDASHRCLWLRAAPFSDLKWLP